MPGVPEGAEGPLHLPAVWDHGLPQGGLLQVQDWYVLVATFELVFYRSLIGFDHGTIVFFVVALKGEKREFVFWFNLSHIMQIERI